MTLPAGEVLQERYRIASLLAEGGMAAIYRAWDSRLEVPVAVKEMKLQPGLRPEHLADLRQQFQQEAQVLARLDHPNLVRVGDFFEEQTNAYLVMDFVKGESLAERIAHEGALPEEQVLAWAEQLLDALGYCHSAGIIHRDVKPQNVIIRPDGRVELVEFGQEKLWDQSNQRTKTQMRGMGTPEYAPPEQYDTSMGYTDASSDVYGLGATLYHALAGEAPLTVTMRMAAPEEFKPLDTVAGDVSQQTADTVMRALALARSERWQSAREMAHALGVPVSAWEDGKTEAEPISATRERTRKMRLTQDRTPSRDGSRQNGDKSISSGVHPPIWAWGLGGLALFLVIAGVAMGVGDKANILTPRFTATPTSSPTPTSTRKPTRTPRPPTSSPAPTQTPTRPAAPQAVKPRLVSPTQGMWVAGRSVTFQWEGTLQQGQTYRVDVTHPETQHSESTVTAASSCEVFLPADRHGRWVWTVSVVDNGRVLVTSDETDFGFDPEF
jgi:serine/threonine-protein kinase